MRFYESSSRVRNLFIICLFELALLLYCGLNLSISYYEARLFFQSDEIIGYLVRASCAIFGQNDLALRLPMIILHASSVVLLYKLSKFYLKFEPDRIICTLLFMLLPGTLASALVLNNAGLCIFLTLAILYAFHAGYNRIFYVLFFASFFIDGDFLILYLAFFIYGLYRKNAFLSWVGALLFLASLYVFGFDTRGRPSGHFVDTFGVFAAVFSPFVFIFFVYTLYRIWIKEKKDLLWFVCICSFCFCMVVSVRQKLELEEFLPFCIIATPLMVRVFFNSYRVRLPQFRKTYRLATALILVFLGLNWLFLIFNQVAYKFIDEPNNHFVYKFNVARDLANRLKEMGLDQIYTEDNKLALRLKFYNINVSNNSDTILLNSRDYKFADVKIEIFDKTIAAFDIRERDAVGK
ncbi:hypothetical protein CCAL6883_05795 [Campylobacter sp. RM6883]|uniref:hypothetical protein n=1 Tax=Campylobacter californiensis TaxID=1032243 RepID=UPI0014512339|nr:hypothetical protein [Campylobacter sp. RM6914]MBE2984857.1 hypothetical protein [Campylobacter sp. RM6883]MBE2995367.1 hypothetical protein [Campylobacter sp. RM6913]QCD51140.1 putative membrane protein [Campylobacter sp. RM6914]